MYVAIMFMKSEFSNKIDIFMFFMREQESMNDLNLNNICETI